MDAQSLDFELPSQGLRRGLDQAHEQGFRRFLRDIGHNARNPAHRRRASTALVTLMAGLNRGAPTHDPHVAAGYESYESQAGLPAAPDYDDPYVAAAYMVRYHLSHCMMAYWAFKHLLGHAGSIPSALYVCDVGAGTGAARVGLALALLQLKDPPSTIHFDAVEPSCAMRAAGRFFGRLYHREVRSRRVVVIARMLTCRSSCHLRFGIEMTHCAW